MRESVQKSVVLLPYGLAGLCALFIYLSGCSRADAPPPPPVPVAPAADTARYVGDESCASCHEDLYMSYHRTGMGRSVSRFDPATAPERFDVETVIYHPGSDFYYEAYVRGDTLYQREFRRDAQGRVIHEQVYPVAWVIGSGNATRSYLMEVNGHVTEMPLTWYVERQKWDLSPSYEQRNMRFSRPIVSECMTCHNGLPEHSPFTPDHYTDVPLGITCERCHGPGSEHVELHLAGMGPAEGTPDPSIVNPSRLSRDLQLSVCQQCHLTGVTVFKPGEDATTFRPGRPLASNREVFVAAEQVEDPERFGISSHAQRLARSACYLESEMTCTTCHDPHVPVAELGDDHFNQVCQSCHQPTEEAGVVCSRTAAHTAAEAMTGNCVSCHLQRSGTSDIPHVLFTDHWIRRRVPPARDPASIDRALIREAPLRLVRMVEGNPAGAAEVPDAGASAAEALEAAIAYFTFYDTKHRIPDYLPKVVAQARAGLEGGADHPEGRIALGRALLDQGDAAEAVRVFAQATTRYPRHAGLLYWQGVASLQAGHPAAALPALQDAVGVQPAFTEAWIKLGEALQQAGRVVEAEQAYRAALAQDSVHHPAAWNNLGYLYLQTERLAEAAPMFEKALALDPDLTVALVNAGTLSMLQEDFAAAVPRFERALVLEPDYIPALGNLAVAYGRLGRYDRGVELLERLLRLQPNSSQASAMLAQFRAML